MELVFVGEADALAAERAAVELVLREYRERGQVEVRVAPGATTTLPTELYFNNAVFVAVPRSASTPWRWRRR